MAALVAGTFAIGVYGGYFTAAQGILLIGTMGGLLPESMQRMNAARNLQRRFATAQEKKKTRRRRRRRWAVLGRGVLADLPTDK
jgi:hypothetical protein